MDRSTEKKSPLGNEDWRTRKLPVPCPSIHHHILNVRVAVSLLLKLVQCVTNTYMEVQICDFYTKPETINKKDDF